ncbi:MAG: hypothetical protein SVM80_08505 [Halobacteriota archaeon]|nr:hypothetical protein [Halobacteriota archaeon]
MNSKIMTVASLIIIMSISSVSVFALFGEEHVWGDISPSGNQISCEKCHDNIVAEFEAMSLGHPHKNITCEDCHRSDPNVTYASGDGSGSTFGEEAHAASIPSCDMCHVIHTGNITSVNETHKPLQEKATLNEACITCHTGFDKKMNFTRPLYIEYDITNVSGNWGVQNFSFVLSNTTTTYSNQTGNRHTLRENDCFDCHSDVKSALENGGHVPKSDSSTQGQAGLGHQGRNHNFDRSDVTIDSCKTCHLANTSDFSSSYSHEGHAQLDYHAATTEHCYNCHYNSTPTSQYCASVDGCHKKLKSGDHDDILNSMFSQGFCWYDIDKVCIGCHIPGYPSDPEPFNNTHFEVYTEPNTIIDIS